MVFNKAFSEINYSDIEELISQKISENQNLEYKKITWGRNDEEVREMLRDISSMANGYGGYIILGLEEGKENGYPIAIHNIKNAEDEKDRIFSSCVANLRPRIPGINIKCLDNGKVNIVLLYIPHSLRAPHIITFKGLNQFWVRHDRQKSIMSVEEIRDAFLRSSAITDNTWDFLAKKKSELLVDAGNKPLFVLGAIPLGIYEELVDVGDEELRNKLKDPIYNRHGGWDLKFFHHNAHPSFHGLIIGDETEGYKQLEIFRNVYIEARADMSKDGFFIEKVATHDEKQVPIIYGYAIIEFVYSFLDQINTLHDYLGINAQFSIFCSFLNIKGHGLRKFRPRTVGYNSYLEIWDKENLEIPLLTFEYVEKDKITKIITDRIWQSFGYDNSDNFYKEGKFDTEIWK